MYKKGRVNSNSRIISTDEDPSLRIESSAIINLRGVSTKLNKYKRIPVINSSLLIVGVPVEIPKLAFILSCLYTEKDFVCRYHIKFFSRLHGAYDII